MGDFILVFLYFLTLTAIITAVYGSLQREANHSLYVILLSMVIAFFALGSLIVLGSNHEESAFIGLRIQHIGQPFIGGIWFLYTMDVYGYSIKRKSIVVPLMALPVIMALGITAGDPLSLYFHSLSYEHNTVFLPYITGDYTLLYNIGLFHIYGLCIVSSILGIHKIITSENQSKTRYFVHLLTGLLPAIFGIMSILLDIPYKREVISTSLCISSVILNLYLLKSGAFRVVAKAKYQLFESVQDGIVIVNKRNEYMDSNDRAKLIFPVLAKARKGTLITSMEGFSPIFAQVDEHGNKFTITNGTVTKHYTITRSELLEDHQYIGSIFMVYDATDTVEKEISEKSNRAKSEFLSRMSHEMRTPMNTIMGMTTLAKNTSGIESCKEMLDQINSASFHLLKLIDDILDMSDIEDNTFRLFQSEFSFAAMLQEVSSKNTPDIIKKQQSLITNIDPSIPDTLIGDERRFTQVMMNLLSNAIKFTPEQGLLQINVFARQVENETLTLEIAVIDSGIGISEEQRKKLFIPFEQVDGGIDRKFGGTGLGLAISKHIIELMGGEIHVESELAQGSKFTFTVKTKIGVAAPATVSLRSLDGKRILLVEDMDINREIVLAMMEGTGLQIMCAENGCQAVTMFSENPNNFDLILMDINMPEMDGVEATRRIRSLGTPGSERIPIIAMTANVLTSEVETYLAIGMTDHIGKPIDFNKLLRKLYRHLES